MSDRTAGGAETRLLSRGVTVFVGLGVLTVVEYVIAIAGVPLRFALLTVIALGKAALIVQYFMHLAQLRREGGH
jgi:cytochrome c oxidase subunit IV